jgi:hypothetical protein
MNGFSDTGPTQCFFGTAFKAGHVGFINEVKFFMKRFQRSNFVGKTMF